tara:strand:- start:865 stop:1050 length:186 start_codon:yes stop_codon:yes gene_type:complete
MNKEQIEASLERFIRRLESLNRMFMYGSDLRMTKTELRTIESVEKAIERLSRAFERAATRL